MRIGVIGLGAGTLAAYGRVTDTVEFYEINPLMSQAAVQYFDYIGSTPAGVTITPGDGRISLEHQPPQQFRRARRRSRSPATPIPMHLLTIQSLPDSTYANLAPGGIPFALHLSNSVRQPDTRRPARPRPNSNCTACAYGRRSPYQRRPLHERPEWVLIAQDPSYFANPLLSTAMPIPGLDTSSTLD